MARVNNLFHPDGQEFYSATNAEQAAMFTMILDQTETDYEIIDHRAGTVKSERFFVKKKDEHWLANEFSKLELALHANSSLKAQYAYELNLKQEGTFNNRL